MVNVVEPSEYILNSFKDNNIDYIKEVFLNAPYDKQIIMYAAAINLEYYEVLQEIVKLLPELPEEFLFDVEEYSDKYNKL